MPALVGEPDAESHGLKGTLEASELASLIKKPAGESVARGAATADEPAESDELKKHG